ncbi:MAG TPA: hypothetical protein VMZ52_05815 [Bryobacteraceae bacterium]|nr:hypothetical protein [Bryobacteraceae bacterium]
MKRTLLLSIATAALAIVPAAFAETSTLGVTVAPEASFTTVAASTSLSKSDTTFGAYSGTTTFSYKIRSTQTTGTGSIAVQVSTFGTGGPAVSDLAYTCTAPSSGTPCSSSTAASTAAATSIVGFGADAHSADSGDSGTAVWTLQDRTAIKTGDYTSTATFTISAT